MQIVIDIPKDVYEDIITHIGEGYEYPDAYYLKNVIKNGIPLPQNHGDLIDSNRLKASMFCYMKDMNKSYTARYVMSVAKGLVDFQKPLVKADERDE